MLPLEISSKEIESLIEEQRNLLKNGDSNKEECYARMDYLKKQFNIIIKKERKINENVVHLTNQTNLCAICFNIHPFKKLLKTSCNHYFGIECFNKWSKSCKNTRLKNVTCPNCRTVNPKLSFFKLKHI